MVAFRSVGYIVFSIILSGCTIAPGMTFVDVDDETITAEEKASGLSRSQIQKINPQLIAQLATQDADETNTNIKLEADQAKTSLDAAFFDETTTLADNSIEQPELAAPGAPGVSTNPSASKIAQGFNNFGVLGAADYKYRVGPADILTIIVWDHPELTLPAGAERSAEQAGTVVDFDGTIYFPYAGVINVGGMTLAEIRDLLTEKLSGVIQDVKLDVRMAAFNHQRVSVVGEVRQPSVQPITNIPPTVIEMVNAAGGFTENADTQLLTLTRNGETFRLDLQALYEQGDYSQNMLLQPGDILNVWDNSLNKVFVMGEVVAPGSYLVNKGRKSLAEAIADAGGVDANTSNPEQIFVFRAHRDKPTEIFHLDARSPAALALADQFPLQARDVVYIDAAEVVRWSRVVQNVSGTISTLSAGSAADFPLFKGNRF